MSNGFVVYEGPSMLDGKPIVAIATMRSSNRKTGPMVQSWILAQDVNPIEAIKTADDFSICGNCKYRGDHGVGRSCYVNVAQAPNGVYKAWRAGNYKTMTNRSFRGYKFRFGAYGDPTAVPYEVWDGVAKQVTGWTGYTHQWADCDQRFKNICMASVDSHTEMMFARENEWRTFRVVSNVADIDPDNEVWCPATKEGGETELCFTCLACKGLAGKAYRPQQKSICVVAHGSGKKHIKQINQALADHAWNKESV